ncbi:MAG: protein phosphatase CheZ [Herminiimonas sp.]|nr:protein phosphatase CheZ [Herminiimonas sp.]
MAGSDDDFDALFEEISAQRDAGGVATATAPPAAPVAVIAPAGAAHASSAAVMHPAHESEGDGADQSDKPMFTRLGGIVRLLHDSLRELGYDRSLSTVATEITDAKDRLEYVASLTEQAANKVLNAIDIGMPAQDVLAKQAKAMEGRWAALYDGKLNVDEFKQLAGDSRQFATTVAEATDAEKARLLEIMMAQDFQDITGQLIKKIVIITHTAEKELAQLLRDNAPAELKAVMQPVEAKPVELLNGPSLEGAAMAQDGVDDLLESLGF